MSLRFYLSLARLAAVVIGFQSLAADQPQWGQAWSRNMVSGERGLPASFDPASGKRVKWAVQLGTETHSTPVVAGGRVFIGTNNGHPRDSSQIGDRGILMCFSEKTGDFLWQLVVPKRKEDVYFDWPESGIASPATVEGDRVYLVSNRGEVLCLSAAGNAGQAEILWRFDLTTGAGIWSHDAAHSSILIRGDLLYLNTGTGVDNTHKRIRDPRAPSLVALDKRDGHLIARETENIAPNIFHSTWSAPSLGPVNGRDLLFFAAGNGIVYAFDPVQSRDREGAPQRRDRPPRRSEADGGEEAQTMAAGRAAPLHGIWHFDFDPSAPKANVHKYNSNRRESPSNFYGMPVLYENHLYAAGGGDLWWGKNEAWLKCINPSGAGDITTNGLVWTYALNKHVLGTPAISRGLVFIADCGRTFHCVDARTGAACWTEDIEGETWASPLVADGKVYLGTRAGVFYIFAASREKRVLSKVNLGKPISSTAVAANGVLYVATMDHLYAIAENLKPQTSTFK